MAFSKGINDKGGMGRKFGNAVPEDEGSNKGASGPSKRIGPIKGRVTFSKGGHNAERGNAGKDGIDRNFGNGIPTEDRKGRSFG